MWSSWTLAAFGLICAALGLNVHRPPRRPAPLALAGFFPGWILGELPLHAAFVQLALTVALVLQGALDAWPGWVGLGGIGASVALLVAARREHGAARRAVEAFLGEPLPLVMTLRQRLYPFWMRHPDVRLVRSVSIARDLDRRLVADVLAPRDASEGAPVLIFVHGGAWVVGGRRMQGLPLMRRLASAGWVCLSVGYRLSPRATFPAHIIDVNRAIAWARTHAQQHGGDPDRVFLAGNSAGAHLATLAALAPGYAPWRPEGYEDVDLRVAGCVACYGVYDLLQRGGVWPHRGLQRTWELLVLKRRLADARARFAEASPWEHVGPDAPPILLVHGARDSLVPPAESRRFAERYEALAPGRCDYLEVPGAQHAFDIFDSPRALIAVECMARWLERRADEAGTAADAPA